MKKYSIFTLVMCLTAGFLTGTIIRPLLKTKEDFNDGAMGIGA